MITLGPRTSQVLHDVGEQTVRRLLLDTMVPNRYCLVLL